MRHPIVKLRKSQCENENGVDFLCDFIIFISRSSHISDISHDTVTPVAGHFKFLNVHGLMRQRS